MFAGKTLINKICKIHHRTLQVVYNEYNKSYQELLQLNNIVSIHQRHLQYLALEVFKSLMHLNPEFMWSYFNEKPITYDLRKGTKVFLPPVKSFRLGLNSVHSVHGWFLLVLLTILYQLEIKMIKINTRQEVPSSYNPRSRCQQLAVLKELKTIFFNFFRMVVTISFQFEIQKR